MRQIRAPELCASQTGGRSKEQMADLNMRNTTLCYIEKNGKYLMLHRVKKENDLNQDKWVGIGGKFEEGESPEECLLREVREETGLLLLDWEYRGIVTFVSDVWGTEYMHLFLSRCFIRDDGGVSSVDASSCDSVVPERKECDEGVLEWIDTEELLRKQIWEGDRIFLRLLKDNSPFFSLKLCYAGDTLKSAVLNGRQQLI